MAEKGVMRSADIDLALEKLSNRVKSGSTLSEVLNDPLIISQGRGSELSDKQRGLVATVVSVMQDKVLNAIADQNILLHEQLVQERRITAEFVKGVTSSFIQGIKQAWSAPLVTTVAAPKQADRGSDAQDEGEAPSKGFRRFLTWGNLATTFAIVFLAVALYFTKAYSSYKDRADNQATFIEELKVTRADQQQSITNLTEKIGQLSGELSVLKEESAIWKAKAETAQARIEQLQVQVGGAQSAEDLQQQIGELSAKLADAASRAAAGEQKTIAARNESATYQKLWKEATQESERFEAAAGMLNKENNKLKLELEREKSKR